MGPIEITATRVEKDPGGITAEDTETDPTQARAANLAFDAGEVLEQTRIGLRYKTGFGEGRELSARVYNSDRDFSNKLPFQDGGIVQLARRFYGAGPKYIVAGELGGKQNRLCRRFFGRIADQSQGAMSIG